MKRSDLVNKLKQVQAGLALNDYVPLFACFCFNGKTVVAYNDVVALQAPCPLEVKGAVKGAVLLGFLSATRVPEVELSSQDGDIHIKAGRAKLKLPVIAEPGDFVFKWPDDKGEAIPFGKEAMEMLAYCTPSMGTDPSRRMMMGVTIAFDGEKNKATLYSTDNKSASRSVIEFSEAQWKMPKSFHDKAVILPPRFCELLLSNASEKLSELVMGDGWVKAVFETGLKLFSRTIPDADPQAYKGLFSPMVGKDMNDKYVAIPKGIERALERSLVVIASKDDTVKLTVKGEVLTLETSSSYGVAKDVLRMEGHEDEMVEAQPSILARVLATSEEMAIVGGSCVAFRRGRCYHLVSVVGTAADTKSEE